jgi:hypothetical protein
MGAFKQRGAFRGVARIVQRGGKKFLALACEFFLRCPEVCNPCCDFLPLPGGPLRLFGHNSPFLSRVSRALVAAIGARIGVRRCGIVVANRVPALQVHSGRPCYNRHGQTFGYFHDCTGPSQRRGGAWRHDRRSLHHCSIHGRGHFDRMRDPRFPLARRIMDPQPSDSIRRVCRQF